MFRPVVSSDGSQFPPGRWRSLGFVLGGLPLVGIKVFELIGEGFYLPWVLGMPMLFVGIVGLFCPSALSELGQPGGPSRGATRGGRLVVIGAGIAGAAVGAYLCFAPDTLRRWLGAG